MNSNSKTPKKQSSQAEETRTSDRERKPLDQQPDAISLEAYGEAHRLDPRFLQNLGITTRTSNGHSALRIPYYDEKKNETATRFQFGVDEASRFSWAKKSHIIPYGVWKLPELLHYCTVDEGESPYLFLVEGESNAQTMWSYGIPALGIPGASMWKPEWAQYVNGLQVYIWKEPDAGGEKFVEKIVHDIPDAWLVVPPEGRKDISECHRLDDNVPQLLATLRSKAVSFKSIADKKVMDEAKEAYQAAEELLHSDILSEFEVLINGLGLVGEMENAKLLYLSATSRLLENPVSIIVKGPSSSGKSFTVETVLKTFPPDAYYAISAMSERALAYSQEPLKHRMLVIYEAAGISSDFALYLVRSLLSEGRIRYLTVESTKNGLNPREIVREGPTGLIITTTKINIHPENETRMISLLAKDDTQQTHNILLMQGLEANGQKATQPDITRWHALQTWLALGGKHEVVIPFASILAENTKTNSVRMRRDFGKVLSLIKTSAILYQLQREQDEQGRIIASIDDYEIVYGLVHNLVSEAVQISVSKKTRETVNAVEGLLGTKNGDSSVTITQLASRLGLDISSASRRAKAAIEQGYLNNLEDHRGKPARLTMGERMSQVDIEALPDPDVIRKIMGGGPLHNSATVQQSVTRSLGVDKREIIAPSSVSLEQIADESPYPDTSRPCVSCGEMAWRERTQSQGGGPYCGRCHP